MKALYRFRVATNPENALNRSVMNERYGIQLPLIASRVPHKVLTVHCTFEPKTLYLSIPTWSPNLPPRPPLTPSLFRLHNEHESSAILLRTALSTVDALEKS